MKILFIGGTGTISMAITRLLAQRGDELWLLNRGSRNEGLPENVKIINCDINDEIYGENNNAITVHTYCENPIKIAREYIKNINEKRIIPINNNIEKITVYTNKTNIETLKNNWDKYILQIKKIEENHSYENELNKLENENRELKQEIKELKKQLDN